MSITVMTTVAPASRPRPVAMSMKRTQPATAAFCQPSLDNGSIRKVLRLRDGYRGTSGAPESRGSLNALRHRNARSGERGMTGAGKTS